MSQNKPQTENALLAGSVRPALLRFAGPIILTMVATQLYAVADTMIVGLCLDAGALACVLLVPLWGYSGFYLASFVSAPAGFLLAAGLARAGARRAAA